MSEATLAAEAGLLDVRTRRWCAELFDEIGVRASCGVPIERAGAVVGAVRRDSTDLTGLPVDVPVVVSAADTQCGLLGLGVGRAGQVGIVAGWSIPLLMVTEAPAYDAARRTWTGCYVDESLWSLESTCGDAGNSYRWLADTMWAGETRPFDRMDAAARGVPGRVGRRPGFSGGRRGWTWAGSACGRGGLIFPVPLTFGGIGRGHAARAALEATSFAVRANLEQLESVSGVAASRIALGGGMTATSSWVEMLPNVLGRPVEVASAPDVTASGAYVTAVAALDGLDSLSARAEASATTTTIDPSPVDSAEYEDLYGRWSEVARHLEASGV